MRRLVPPASMTATDEDGGRAALASTNDGIMAREEEELGCKPRSISERKASRRSLASYASALILLERSQLRRAAASKQGEAMVMSYVGRKWTRILTQDRVTLVVTLTGKLGTRLCDCAHSIELEIHGLLVVLLQPVLRTGRTKR